jgi:hypothetical protein
MPESTISSLFTQYAARFPDNSDESSIALADRSLRPYIAAR